MMSRKVFIGDHLRTALENSNMSQADLARETKLAFQLISKYVNNQVVPTATSLILMAMALDCSVDFLITGKDFDSEKPVKPYLDFDGHDVWRCGKCNTTIFHIYDSTDVGCEKAYAQYCRHCGRKVDWDADDQQTENHE